MTQAVKLIGGPLSEQSAEFGKAQRFHEIAEELPKAVAMRGPYVSPARTGTYERYPGTSVAIWLGWK